MGRASLLSALSFLRTATGTLSLSHICTCIDMCICVCIHIHTHMYSIPFYNIYLHISNIEDLLYARHGAEHSAHLFPRVLIVTVTEVPSLQERKLGPRETEYFAQSYIISEWQSHCSKLL